MESVTKFHPIKPAYKAELTFFSNIFFAASLAVSESPIVSNLEVIMFFTVFVTFHQVNVDQYILIVVETRGISGIKKTLLGITASGVVTYAHCPVMVVK